MTDTIGKGVYRKALDTVFDCFRPRESLLNTRPCFWPYPWNYLHENVVDIFIYPNYLDCFVLSANVRDIFEAACFCLWPSTEY